MNHSPTKNQPDCLEMFKMKKNVAGVLAGVFLTKFSKHEDISRSVFCVLADGCLWFPKAGDETHTYVDVQIWLGHVWTCGPITSPGARTRKNPKTISK